MKEYVLAFFLLIGFDGILIIMARDGILSVYAAYALFPDHVGGGGIGFRVVLVSSKWIEVLLEHARAKEGIESEESLGLCACVGGLEKLSQFAGNYDVTRAVLYTHSDYVRHNIGRAMFEWPKRKWLDGSGQPLAYASQWKTLIRKLRRVPVNVEIAAPPQQSADWSAAVRVAETSVHFRTF